MAQIEPDRGLSRQALLYSGWDKAVEQLPNLGMTWDTLRDIVVASRKPAADLGSCFSPYPVEAHVRGITVVPIDPRYGTGQDPWRSNVLKRLGPIAPDAQSTIHEAVHTVEQTRLNLSALQLKQLPERYFSVITAHDALPKHTRSFDFFLSQELPNMLRVADHSVRLYPFAIHKENDKGELVEAHALYRDESALEATRRVAREHGFDLQLFNNSCAVFTRVAGVSLRDASF